MSVPVIIIIGGPRPNGRTTDQHEFPSIEAAIDFLQHIPPTDELPSGDGTSES